MKRRHITLIEVLISFFLISITLLPLVEMQMSMVREERWQLDKKRLRHMVNELFAEKVLLLWTDPERILSLIDKPPEPIVLAGIPVQGEFEVIQKRPKKAAEHPFKLLHFHFRFFKEQRRFEKIYAYDVCAKA